jgi:hypothetical protein
VPARVEKAIDDLYGQPLDRFTPARDALVHELRQAGDKAAADEVKRLRKPTVSAWAINQLARKERMRIRSLLVAGEKLRKAHAELLGGGRPAEVRQASDAERKAIDHLVSSAAKILSQTGHSASESALERVATTLRAAAVDEDGRAVLERGRLTRDLDPTGFGPLDLTAKPGRQRSKAGRRADEGDRRRQERRQAVEEQVRARRAELRELGKAAVDADGNVAAAERNLQAAERKARKVRETYDRAERRLKDAESDLQHLRRRK